MRSSQVALLAKVSPQRSRAMGAIKGKGNKTTERRLRFGIVRAGIRGWRLHARWIVGNPDFFFAHHAVAVFVDGCFWHGCQKCGHVPRTNNAFWSVKIERNRVRDAETTVNLAARGITVLRFWEHELQTDMPGCLGRLREALRTRDDLENLKRSGTAREKSAVLPPPWFSED